MTEPIEGQEQQDEGVLATFSDEQQRFFNKRMKRIKEEAREKAEADVLAAQGQRAEDAKLANLAVEKKYRELAELHEARVKDLEPLVAQVEAYREVIEGMLKDRIKALGEAAKTAVKALPKSLTNLDKLNWLNKSQGLFDAGPSGVGTPAARRRTPQKSKSVEGRRRAHL